MTNPAHILEPRLYAAALALAQSRMVGLESPLGHRDHILDWLPQADLLAVVEEARAILAAADLVALAPKPRKPGTLTEIDAAALGLDLGARGVLILTLDANSRLAGALWSQGGPAGVLHGPALGPVWSNAVATFARTLSQESRR